MPEEQTATQARDGAASGPILKLRLLSDEEITCAHPTERIQKQIFLLRGQKVMLSQHLAELYGVPVGALIRLKRNRESFLMISCSNSIISSSKT